MIIEERNRKPFINFGFNIVSKTETTNKDIDVYLDTLYNLDRYNSFTFTAPSANVTKINDYYYKVSYSSAGSYAINMTITSNNQTIILNSNTINILIT